MVRILMLSAVLGQVCLGSSLDGQREPLDYSDPKALEAYGRFWEEFEKHDDKRMRQALKVQQEDSEKIDAAHQEHTQALKAKFLETLEKAESTYRSTLRNHPSAENRS